MKKRLSVMRRIVCCLVFVTLLLGSGFAMAANADKAVNVILKNGSSNGVTVELIDQYGGNFTVTVDGGTSQNQSLKMNSKITIGGKAVHVVTAKDEGKEVTIGQ
ncbi:MAG: hypothetical protein KJ630_20980 [Proteobacteria bacterium]|nr:hypothetical protein [Pseudomonadota bacterium]